MSQLENNLSIVEQTYATNLVVFYLQYVKRLRFIMDCLPPYFAGLYVRDYVACFWWDASLSLLCI